MMKRLKSELHFLRALFALNLASAMEYRASFLTQAGSMFLNNGIYFLFWMIFFDRFDAINGYELREVYLLFGIVALAFGLATLFAGNIGPAMAELIAQGRLDYYLALPRSVLPHVIGSRMQVTAFGEILFGIVAFALYGRLDLQSLLLFLTTSVLAGLVFVGFSIIAGSLAFFMGHAQQASAQMQGSMLTFSLYPQTLFTGPTKLLLYTLLPAGFIGGLPVEIVSQHNWSRLPLLLAGVVVIWVIALAVFHFGLQRYESGSALNVNV